LKGKRTLESRGTGTLVIKPETHPSGTSTAAVAKVAKRKLRKMLICMIAFVIEVKNSRRILKIGVRRLKDDLKLF
jgi:hypothetical protein